MMPRRNLIRLTVRYLADPFLAAVVAVSASAAYGQPVVIKGYVARLTGEPHTNPDITVTVKQFKSGKEVWKDRLIGNAEFTIVIDQSKIDPREVRLSISAKGVADLDGQRPKVETDDSLIGLAGRVGTQAANAPPYEQHIVLVVPIAKTEKYIPPCPPSYCFRHKHKLRCGH